MRTRKYGALMGAILCLLVLLLCGMGAVAVQQRRVPAPNVRLQLGSIAIEAGVAKQGECPPHCEWELPDTRGAVYTIWLVSSHPDGTTVRRLFAQPLRPE